MRLREISSCSSLTNLFDLTWILPTKILNASNQVSRTRQVSETTEEEDDEDDNDSEILDGEKKPLKSSLKVNLEFGYLRGNDARKSVEHLQKRHKAHGTTAKSREVADPPRYGLSSCRIALSTYRSI